VRVVERPVDGLVVEVLGSGAGRDFDGRVAVSLTMRGFGYPHDAGFVAGVRCLGTGVACDGCS
jgi:hypothetical protein